jgi:polyhydroxybutyrate depolymerase
MRCLPVSIVSLLIMACSSSEPGPGVGAVMGSSNGASGEPATADNGSAPASGAQMESTASPEGTPVIGGLSAAPGTTAAGTATGPVDAAAPSDAAPASAPMSPLASFPPSSGCGNANPPQGAGALSIRGAQADYVVTLPANYDPNTPTPLVFGFHGRNRTHVQFQTVDAAGIQTELGSRAVMVYLKSQGGPGWNFEPEVEPSVEFFEALYPQVLASYCVDTSRIFLVGHSSGAYFSHILTCRFAERFRGIGVVAGQQQELDCTNGRVAATLIHGVADTVVPFAGGQAARDYYVARNGCDATSVPGAVSPCIAYQNCDPGLPVQWCEHTEPTYLENNQPTNHGWPSFASRAIGEFFWSLPPRSE